jgi:uncharacterized protein (DUF433 family)
MNGSPSEIYRREVRFEPAYTVTEASRFLGISRTTLDYWARGKFIGTGDGRIATRAPIIDVARTEKPCMLSFVNLLEADVVRIITQDHSISLKGVRAILTRLKKHYDNEHPLVLHRFAVTGKDLLVQDQELGQFMDHNAQLVMDQLDLYFERVEYRGDLAQAYYIDKARNVKVDPLISFGYPILAGTGYRTDLIAERYWAGDTMDELVEDYALAEEKILQAVEWEKAQRSLRSAA